MAHSAEKENKTTRSGKRRRSNKGVQGLGVLAVIAALSFAGYAAEASAQSEAIASLEACVQAAVSGFRQIAPTRSERFLGKVSEATARCRGGERAVAHRDRPWVDWQNYWGAGDAGSMVQGLLGGGGPLAPNARGIRGALTDLEYQRIELLKFNLFDNETFEAYVRGRDGIDGRSLRQWPEMRLPPEHPHYEAVGGDGAQLCRGELIRYRTLRGICNDTRNPLMGSTGQLFSRNVEFEAAFPRLGQSEVAENRHGDRLGLLQPDPQVISRRLFTRTQSSAERCRDGWGPEDDSLEGHCDYKKAPVFNVLGVFWIQFMTHDWFSHLEEGRNRKELMKMGCTAEQLTQAEIGRLGCRPGDRAEKTLVAVDAAPPRFAHGGREYLERAPAAFRNAVTAWWDASQIYGYDEHSRARAKIDPKDPAKLLLVRAGRSDAPGYLPLFESCAEGSDPACVPDPIHPAWKGQEATAFPDNWTVGLSFFHNVFAREHNLFVDAFRRQARETPDADSGLRDPVRPDEILRYRDVTAEELFEVARLVVAAEIAKIHTIEWTTQLLYNEPLYRAMHANWDGLLDDERLVSKILAQIVSSLGRSEDTKQTTAWYSVFASGAGIFGLGNRIYGRSGLDPRQKDLWSLDNPDHVNGGTNHFGSPFNFPEEFISVYRLHPLVPDLFEYRRWNAEPNVVAERIPLVETFRGAASAHVRARGLANLALSMGRQRAGRLTLHNHPRFLQNLPMPHLQTASGRVDVAALDLIRDRERGIPRFNEFRRQYGLEQLTSFDDFVDRQLPEASPERMEQEKSAKILREIYGRHRCDASKVITLAQRDENGAPINDCLGHPDGTVVDNIEDVDLLVGWLAEPVRPHGFAISETQFAVFVLNASRRLFSDRFFTSSFRPEFYSHFGVNWVNDNGPDGKVLEKGKVNGHTQEVTPLKRVFLRTLPELRHELAAVVNVFDPWTRDRGQYYSLE